jgi:hypothetical protein
MRPVGRREDLRPPPNPFGIGFGNGPDRRRDPLETRRDTRSYRRIPTLGLDLSPAELGFIDIDGTWCSAAEMLDGNGRNHGRVRVGTRETRDGEDTIASPPRWYDLGENAEKIDFLRGSGWHIRKAGTTGTPQGPPRRGFAGDFIAPTVKRVLSVGDYWLARIALELFQDGSEYEARYLCVACVLGAGVNAQAFGDLHGKDRRVVNRYRSKGEDWIRRNLLVLMLTMPRDGSAPIPPNLSHKSPNRGEDDEMSPAVANAILERLDQRLDRIEASTARIELRQQMQGERDDYERERQTEDVDALDES